MGPLTLIDKSAVQWLSLEEIRTMSMHYSIIVCPMLSQEVCANLFEDGVENDETRAKVSYLSGKARNAGHFTITDYRRIAAHDLFTGAMPMREQIPKFGGTRVKDADGVEGIVFDETEEDKRMRRWAAGNFDEEDRKLANDHINYLKNYDLEGSRKDMAAAFPLNTRYKSIQEVLDFHDTMPTWPDQWGVIKVAAAEFGVADEGLLEIEKRWLAMGKPAFDKFAPYAYYCHRLASVFFICVTANLVPTGPKAKSVIDFQYLYYLPFVMALCSADKFQFSFAKYFLREDQSLIRAQDLKQDLKDIKSCKDAMNEEEKKYYRRNYGSYPPPMPNSLTNKIWQKHMNPWKEGAGNRVDDMSEKEKKDLHEKLMSIMRKAEPKA